MLICQPIFSRICYDLKCTGCFGVRIRVSQRAQDLNLGRCSLSGPNPTLTHPERENISLNLHPDHLFFSTLRCRCVSSHCKYILCILSWDSFPENLSPLYFSNLHFKWTTLCVSYLFINIFHLNSCVTNCFFWVSL